MERAEFSLRPVNPFRLDLTVWALRRRPANEVDRWDGRTWRRVLVVGGEPVEVAAAHLPPAQGGRLRVRAAAARLPPDAEGALISALERMLGLRTSLEGFYRLAADPVLGPLAGRFRGLKPPRFPTLFEALVNAVACQQVSLTVGILLLNRLAAAFGATIETGGGVAHAFPEPGDLAGAEPEELRRLGFSRQKGRSLVELARTAAQGGLAGVEGLEDEAAAERLRALRGVGRWSAEYALLRGLGRLGVFPADDVGARGGVQRWLGLPAPPDYAAIRRALARWQPYSGLIYFHLLLERLSAAGYLAGA